MRGGWTPIKTTRLYVNSAVASVAEISATPSQQRAIDRLARRATNLYLGALPRGGGSYRSASAVVRPDGSTVGWLQRWLLAAFAAVTQMGAPLDGSRGGSLQRYGGAVAFRGLRGLWCLAFR